MIELRNVTTPLSQDEIDQAAEAVASVLQYQHVGFLSFLNDDDLWTQWQEQSFGLREQYDRMVILGIGGSSLGARAILESLEAPSRVDILDNVDAKWVSSYLESRNSEESTCWLIISKSGGTMETLSLASFISQAIGESEFLKNALVMTEADSPLAEWAHQKEVRIVPMAANIGGRFSVLTSVGMFPAAFAGADIMGFREGARQVCEMKELLARIVALNIKSFQRKELVTLFWSYTQRMNQFGRWIQQLWAESLGKSETNDGRPAPHASTPLPAVGPCDQHSILQQVIAAQKDKYIWFLRAGDAEVGGDSLKTSLFEKTNLMLDKGLGALMAAEADATRDSLHEQGVESLTIWTERLDESAMGRLFVLFEIVVASIAHLHGINAFDQPGVESGKVLTRKYLQEN